MNHLHPSGGGDRRETNRRAGKPPHPVLDDTLDQPVVPSSDLIPALERLQRSSPPTRAHGTGRQRPSTGQRIHRQHGRPIPRGLEAVPVAVVRIHGVEREVGPGLVGVVPPRPADRRRQDRRVGGGARGGRRDPVPGVVLVESRAVSHGGVVADREIRAGAESFGGCFAVGSLGGRCAHWVGAPGVEDRSGRGRG